MYSLVRRVIMAPLEPSFLLFIERTVWAFWVMNQLRYTSSTKTKAIYRIEQSRF